MKTPMQGLYNSFQEDRQCKAICRQNKKYRMKTRKIMCMHEDDQEQSQNYWRVIVPDIPSNQDKTIRRNSLCSLCRTPRDGQDIGNGQEVLLLESYDS